MPEFTVTATVTYIYHADDENITTADEALEDVQSMLAGREVSSDEFAYTVTTED